MSSSQQNYYAPYVSEEEDNKAYESDSESGSGSDSDTSDSSFDTTAQRLDDPRYAIVRAAGPSFNTINDQLTYQRGKNAFGAPLDVQLAGIPTVVNSSNSPLLLDNKKRIQTTLFSVKSSNRDRRVWPTSTDFEIKLSRPFKQVTQIQLVQISYEPFMNIIPDVSGFINAVVPYLSTFGVDVSQCLCCFPSASVQNSIGLTEVGRSDPLKPSSPLSLIITARPGRYDNNLLAQEMDYQMNHTPPFNLISYTDHRAKFHSTKTLGHLFNEPGRYFYHRTRKDFITSPTKQDIHNTYYPDSYVHSVLIPSDTETFVAYYFPVLKEAMMSENDHAFLDLLGDTYSAAYKRIVQHFEGLGSTYYYNLCKINMSYLDKYRQIHTFKYKPVYDYTWSYDQGMKRYNVQHSRLHKSILSDVSNRHSENYLTALNTHGVASPVAHTTLTTTFERTKAVLSDLGKKMNNALTVVGVPFGIYHPDTLAVGGNVIQTINPSSVPPVYLNENDTVHQAIATGTLVPSTFVGPYSTPAPVRDFSFVSLTDLASFSLDVVGTPGNYTTGFSNSLTAMNNVSIISGKVGGGYLPGYGGVNVNVTDYDTLYSTFTGYYSTYTGQSTVLSNIATTHQTLTSNYVHTKYGSVLPTGLLSNNATLGEEGLGTVKYGVSSLLVKGSSPFVGAGVGACDPNNSCCELINKLLLNWYSCMPASYVVTTLPWKLGFNPALGDVVKYISTISGQTTTTPNNVYLQLNIEQSMNNMDVAVPENVTITNEPVSEGKVVLGKLLTQGAGLSDITQTIIQNPAQFFTPVGKLDRLHFTMLLDDLTPLSALFPFDFAFTDWDAVIQIDEEINTMERAGELSTVPRVPLGNSVLPV